MKIAFFTDSYFPMLNGVTLSVSNFAKELRASGHTVYIFAPKFESYEDKEKDVYRLNALKVLSTEPEVHMPFLMPHQLVTAINPRDFDIVHAHGNGFFSFLGYQIARLKGIPYILTVHTQHTRYTHYIFNGKLITPRLAATGLRIFSNMSDRVITPSHKMRDDLLSYGVNKEISVIPNFIYTNSFTKKKKGFLHDLCHIPPSSPILLSVGRLGKEKDIPFLLEAFKKIAKQEKSSHLVFVGSGEESEYLKSLTKSYGLTERVHFTGRIQAHDIPKVYADGDIFLYASQTETQGLVVVEAAASGLPFVVVKDGAFEYSIINGKNGYTTSPNTTQFAQKVISLINNPEQRKIFGKTSRELIKRNLEPKKLTRDLVELYEDALLEKSNRKITIRGLNKKAVERLYTTTRILNRIFE